MILTTLSINSRLLLENLFTWSLYWAAVATAVMPLLQGLAFLAAFVVSMLTAIKLLKDLFHIKKKSKHGNNY